MTVDKLEQLTKKRDQLNARIQREKSKEAEKKRKLDTQAKILLGSALLNRLESNDPKANDLLQWCRDALTDKDKIRLDAAMSKK